MTKPIAPKIALTKLKVIPDYDAGEGRGPHVHTFRLSSIGLLGAHWPLDKIRKLMTKYEVRRSGPNAAKMGHGLVVVDERGALFLETKPREMVK